MTVTVLAHGCWDGLHIGHIRHLEAAKALGDRLMVSVTADEYVNKGLGRPVFSLAQRMEAIAALRCVDHVMPSYYPSAADNIHGCCPSIFAKGNDYQGEGIIPEEAEACRLVRAQVVYIGEKLGSSTQAFPAISPPSTALSTFLDTVDCTPEQFRDAVEGLAGLNVVVVGDGIIDEYVECDVMGLTSKASVLSVQQREAPIGLLMQGGVQAVARHVEAFGSCHLHVLSAGTTTKRRYIDRMIEGQPIIKRFSVNITEESWLTETARGMWTLPEADLVMVADFGHGTMTDELRALVQREAKFLAVNCQTNSSNYGFNLIDKRYSRADLFSLDRTELDLAMGIKGCEGVALDILKNRLGSRYGFLTRGDIDTIGAGRAGVTIWLNRERYVTCPALESRAIDTIGAGDAFFAVAALAGARGYPLPLVLLMGQLAGAQAAGIVGNKEPISKSALITAGMALLNR